MEFSTSMVWRALRWPFRWLAAAGDLPAMRQAIREMQRQGQDPLRCVGCGTRLTILRTTDVESMYGSPIGQDVLVRCDTPGCGITTERTRRLEWKES